MENHKSVDIKGFAQGGGHENPLVKRVFTIFKILTDTTSVRAKFGFTLAEVLITLGIIGVVAALTIPNLTAKYREKVFINKLKQTYSILNQAYKMTSLEYGDADGWDIGENATIAGAKKLYDYFKPYLKQAKECREKYGCFPKEYKTFSGKDYGYNPYNHTMYVRGQLMNGVSFAMSSHGSGCPDNYCASIYVDLNGDAPPNRTGEDYFGFWLAPKGIFPMSGRPNSGNGYTCQYKGTTNGNGTGCTNWVLKKENMDYLHRDISSELEELNNKTKQ